MRCLITIVAVLVACACITSSVPGATLEVPGAYPSIQEAIDASQNGDTVVVSPGLYYETINFNGKNIVVTSTDPNDPRIVGYTILNGDGNGSVVTFENNETPAAVLTGFTITGGTATLVDDYGTSKYYYGAGICSVWGSPTITHNVITNNVGPYKEEEVRVDIDGGYYYTYAYDRTYGGGIYYGGSGTVSHNIIYNNSGYYGGGIFSSGIATIENNLVYNNTAVRGGGLYAYVGQVRNNTFVANETGLDPENGLGGNIYAYFQPDYAMLTLSNNIVCNAGSGGGIFYANGFGDEVQFCNVWGNQPANYMTVDNRTDELVTGGTADWTGQRGNISEDPVFASSWSKRYRLEEDSPCISAGDPDFVPASGATDVDGDPRVYARRVDIGADEYIGYVKPLADAGGDQHILNPEPLTLDGTGSYFSDPDGITAFQWTQTEGAAVQLDDASVAQPTFTPSAEGWYRFALVVSDASHSSAPDEVLVVVGNEQPVAQAGADALWPNPGIVWLDGSQSSDADPPDELSYTWTQVDGPAVELWESNSGSPYFECQENGFYTFELVVSDGFTTSDPDRITIQASPFTEEVEPFELPAGDYQYFYMAALSGTGVVYALEDDDYDWTDWQIHWTDIKTGESRVFDGGTVETMPQIEGDLIVWAAGSGYYFQPTLTSIYLGDVTTGEKMVLERATSSQSYGYPAISGNKVVWLRHRDVDPDNEAAFYNCPYDIQGADISDRSNPVYFTIAEDAGSGLPYPHDEYYRSPAGYVSIDGNIVVWEQNGDIYGADIADLENIKTFPICTAAERQFDPAISNHLVVWTDQRDDAGDIYAADISDPNNVREFAVWVDSGSQYKPDVDGAFIVCSEGSNYNGYMRVACVSRDYGVVKFSLPGSYYGGGPDLDGGTLVWVYGSEIRGMHLQLGYGLADGPVQNATTGWQYDYLQHAISAAADGDVILAEPGTYQEKLRIAGKNITVTSADPEDPEVRAATVLKGEGPLVVFDAVQSADCLFTGFTVTGGGFGILCNDAIPTISDCDITGNRDAGIKLWGRSKPTVERCEIADNGIGVEMWANTTTRHVFRNGGTFRNCLVVGNEREGFLGGNPTVSNCTVADNLGYGLSCSSPVVENSIVYFNNDGAENVTGIRGLTVTYSDVQGGADGTGNIDADPLFVARGSWTDAGDWVPGDYHLQSQGWSWDTLQGLWTWDEATSPCIDAGDPTASLGDEAPCEAGDALSERAVNTQLNMGGYGGTAEASLAPR